MNKIEKYLKTLPKSSNFSNHYKLGNRSIALEHEGNTFAYARYDLSNVEKHFSTRDPRKLRKACKLLDQLIALDND